MSKVKLSMTTEAIRDHISNGEALPFRRVSIMTSPSEEQRSSSVTWVIDPQCICDMPFEVEGGLIIDPDVDVLCMSGDLESPTLEWGIWSIKRSIFKTTYEPIQ